jgi:hypothetical protein
VGAGGNAAAKCGGDCSVVVRVCGRKAEGRQRQREVVDVRIWRCSVTMGTTRTGALILFIVIRYYFGCWGVSGPGTMQSIARALILRAAAPALLRGCKMEALTWHSCRY